DIFSRKVIRWEVHVTETGDLAKAFIENAIIANGGARPLYLHADNGTSMTSKPVSQLLADLQVNDSHSKPHASDDIPDSEGRFKPSSTARSPPSFSRRPARPARSASFSSATTTPSTAIPGSGCTPRSRSYSGRINRDKSNKVLTCASLPATQREG